ncbi:hypothetical protein T484DRAFT_1945452 [Baffinella frigidus]|nr:hypothetical protein T484DRAFT_1945452 [Cryptophyta sp. CCMP2293]
MEVHPEPETRNPKPETRNPNPSTRTGDRTAAPEQQQKFSCSVACMLSVVAGDALRVCRSGSGGPGEPDSN